MQNRTDDGWASRYDRMQDPPDVAERVAVAGVTSIVGEIRFLRKHVQSCLRKRDDRKTTGAERVELQREIRERMEELDQYQREEIALRAAAGSLLLDREVMNAYATRLTEMWKRTTLEDQAWHDDISDEDWRLYVEAREAQELAEQRTADYGETA